jgi:hypothetical protein
MNLKSKIKHETLSFVIVVVVKYINLKKNEITKPFINLILYLVVSRQLHQVYVMMRGIFSKIIERNEKQQQQQQRPPGLIQQLLIK